MFGGDEEEEEECLNLKWGGYMEGGGRGGRGICVFRYTKGYKWLLNVPRMIRSMR